MLIYRLMRLNRVIPAVMSVLFSGMLVASLISIFLRGRIIADYLIAGGSVSVIVGVGVLYFIRQVSLLREDNENLQQEIISLKKTEEALKESEAKFRLFLEYCPVYVFIKDKDIRAIHLSRNFEKMVGRPINELLGKTMYELFPPELATSMVEDDRRILREGKPLEVEEEFNGRVYSTLKFPILIEGVPRFLAGFTTDISERKRAEEELRRQIERYDLVAAGIRDGIWDWDVPNKRVFFSARWKSMRGFPEDEISDSEEEWSGRIHPEDAPRVFASVQAHFEGRTPWFSEEYRVRRKDGTWMWVLDRGIALRDAAGRVIRMAGSETDITLRKQMQEEREKLIAELKDVLAKVKTLSGLLPICAHCKKIRDDKGYWKQIEIYIRDRSEAEFSHGICPDCVKKFYPEQYDKIIGSDSQE